MTKEEFAALKVGDVLENLDGTMRVRLVEHVGFVWEAVHVGEYMTGSEACVSAYELWRKLPAPEAEEKLPPILDANGREIRVGDWVQRAPFPGESELPHPLKVIALHADFRGKRETGALQFEEGTWASSTHNWTVVSSTKDVPGPSKTEEHFFGVDKPTGAGAVCAELRCCEPDCRAVLQPARWPHNPETGDLAVQSATDDQLRCFYCHHKQRSDRRHIESGPGIGTVEPVVDVEGECWERPGWES